MFAVIFRATVKEVDSEYGKMAKKLRKLAFETYGCIDFITVCEGDQEIAISYWESETAIKKWKENTEHLIAQELGQKRWYSSYSVQIVEVKHEYRF